VSATVSARRGGRRPRVRSEGRSRMRHSSNSHHLWCGRHNGHSGSRTRRSGTRRYRDRDLWSGLKLARRHRGSAVTATHRQHRQPPTAQRRATARHSGHAGAMRSSSSTTTSGGRRQGGRWGHRRRRHASSGSAGTARRLRSRRRTIVIAADIFAVILGVVRGGRRHRSDSRIGRSPPSAAARTTARHQR
jgi:hypothetical protein